MIMLVADLPPYANEVMSYDKKIIAKVRLATPAKAETPIMTLPPVCVAAAPLPLFVELTPDDLAVTPLPLPLGTAVAAAA